MSQTTPPSLTAPGTAPDRSDRATFSARATAFATWMGTAVTEFAALATNVYNNAVDCYNNAVAAAASAVSAAASATTAVNAPGTSATSTTSLTIGTGSQSLTVQTGKSFAVGQAVIIAYTTSPGNYMLGYITSYTSGTGALVVTVTTTSGSGTQSAWTVSLTSPIQAAALASQQKTTTYTAVAGDVIDADTSGGAWTLTLPASPNVDDCVTVTDLAGTWHTNNLTIGRNSSKIMGSAADMTANVRYARITLKYTGATYGWIII